MHTIEKVEPVGQLLDDGSRIWSRAAAGAVALDCAHERFGHTVPLRAFDWVGSRDRADIAGEAPSVACGVAAAVVGSHSIVITGGSLAQAMLDCSNHEIAHVFRGDAASGRYEAHGVAIAALEGA